jgi:HD superfamily phosphohydrolase
MVMEEIFSIIRYRPFSPASAILWEPIWNLSITLSPCERDLLNTSSLRRLGFVRTFGAGGLVMPTQHSRLSHIQGVFALAAHFQPNDQPLRLAALLHDVGHGPFSHSAEVLPDFNHHDIGREIIFGDEVGKVLHNCNIDPAEIVALIEGQPPNPVRTQNGLLHLDHLDFFLRDPFVCGWHTPSPAEILSRLYLDGPNVATDLATAEHLIERILFEHQLFTAPIKVAAEAVLEHVLTVASQKKLLNLDPQDLAMMTDADLLIHLVQTNEPEITRWLGRLLRRPESLTVRRAAPDEPPPAEAITVRFENPYLNQPLVHSRPVSEVSERAASLLAEARELLGTFVVEASD